LAKHRLLPSTLRVTTIASQRLINAMMERYSHIRMEAKRRAVDDLSGTDFEPGVARHWAQFSVSEKSEGANSLTIDGEPGRTRTSNPLFALRNAKYLMFQAVSPFRGMQN
jgi:hypothetical protein